MARSEEHLAIQHAIARDYHSPANRPFGPGGLAPARECRSLGRVGF
jgi:hypothetical protein